MRAGGGFVVDGGEAGRGALGVALRGRGAGVAEQLLDRAEIAAAGEEVRRETVAERVRRRGLREAKGDAEFLHLPLYEARVERPATCADEERSVGREVPRA